MAMLDEKSDIVSGEKIRAITVKISVQSGYQNDRFHELMEESNRIRDTKRRCSILEELRKIDDMRAGFYKDLETIHKSLESKARFGREDVDLGELAAELYEKYSYSRRRLDKGSGRSA